MSTYTANQNSDTVSCPQCGGTGKITEVGASGVTMQSSCGLCHSSGTVTRKQERAYYNRASSASHPPISESEIIILEEKARAANIGDGVTCPACRGKGVVFHPKTGNMESCKLCGNSGFVSRETAKIWKTRS